MMCTSRCVLAIFAVSCAQQSWDSLHDVHGPSTRRRPGDRRRPGQGAASQASGFSAGTATSAGPRRCGRCGSPGARSRCSTSFWATLRRQRFPRPRQAAGARGSAGASRPGRFPRTHDGVDGGGGQLATFYQYGAEMPRPLLPAEFAREASLQTETPRLQTCFPSQRVIRT